MGLIFKISKRNLMRHKGKSIIIGVILFLGALLMTFGNGVISGLERGLENNIVNGFLGDIVLVSSKEKSDNILMKMYGESIAPIRNYKEIKVLLASQNYMVDFLPVGKNAAWIINEEEGDPGYSNLIGVEIEKYQAFFPNSFNVLEGRNLKKGESGILFADGARGDMFDRMNIWFVPGNGEFVEKNVSENAKPFIKSLNIKKDAVFMGFSDGNATADIRLGIKGVIKYKSLNKIWGQFLLVDIESYRRCLGYFSATDSQGEISQDKQKLMDLDNLDDLFKEDKLIITNQKNTQSKKVDFTQKKLSTTEGIDLESGLYNMVFVKLKKGVDKEASLNQLNEVLKNSKLELRAIGWRKAAGFIGNMATIMSGALFFFVLFLFVVAIIVIVNTMTMAALERTTEIGMMRAIGARKSFISKMFMGEISILSLIFGGFGIICGVILVWIIPGLNITTENDIVQLLYGGDKFMPYLAAPEIVAVIVQLIVVTFLTALYPVKVAKSITPLDAITRD